MKAPFFFRKKFLAYYGIFVFALLLIGIALTTVNYFEAKAIGEIRWEIITVPLTLPIMGLAGYVLILPMWVVYKAKQFQRQAISRIPEVFTPVTPTPLPNGEIIFGDTDRVGYNTPEGKRLLGEIRFTNHRIVFSTISPVQRMGELYGLPPADQSISIALSEIRQCGFGLDEKNPKYFLAIENNGKVHAFTSIVKFNAEIAMKELGWKRTQIDKHAYWIR